MSLIPRRRLLAAILVGAGLIALGFATALAFVAAALYHGALAWLAVRDARGLPRSGYRARRTIPDPFSMGASQAISVTVEHPAAAGLRARLADHPPRELAACPREVEARFDGGGRLEVAYRARAPHRGDFAFGPVDLRCWREGGLLVRQVRLPLPQTAAVYPDLVAVRAYQAAIRKGLRLSSGGPAPRAPPPPSPGCGTTCPATTSGASTGPPPPDATGRSRPRSRRSGASSS